MSAPDEDYEDTDLSLDVGETHSEEVELPHEPGPEVHAPKFDTVNAPLSELPQRAAAEITATVIPEPQPPAEPPALINMPKTSEEIRVEDFVAKVMAERNEQPKEYNPPPMTENQMSAREAELAAGRRRVKHFEEQKALRPPPPIAEVAAQGTTTPVFRPPDHVPNMQQGQVGARNVRG